MIDKIVVPNWDVETLQELLRKCLNEFANLEPKCKVRKVLVVGSRVVKEFNVFLSNSDLNIELYVAGKFTHYKFSFMYRSLVVNCRVYRVTQFSKARVPDLPYFDLVTRKYHQGKKEDIFKFYFKDKGRYIKTSCMFCGSNTYENILFIDYRDKFSRSIDEKVLPVCNTCYKKFQKFIEESKKC